MKINNNQSNWLRKEIGLSAQDVLSLHGYVLYFQKLEKYLKKNRIEISSINLTRDPELALKFNSHKTVTRTYQKFINTPHYKVLDPIIGIAISTNLFYGVAGTKTIDILNSMN